VWKNPKITDKHVRDELESRLQTLTDQMRVMEKVLADREREIEVIQEQLQQANTDVMTSPSPFTSPIGSPAIRSSPMRLSQHFVFPLR
jgi:t-SNARE complex subunit (syntaxin)